MIEDGSVGHDFWLDVSDSLGSLWLQRKKLKVSKHKYRYFYSVTQSTENNVKFTSNTEIGVKYVQYEKLEYSHMQYGQ